MEKRATAQDLQTWAESLAGIAKTGLGFTKSLYERERFEEVLKVASEISGHAAADPDFESIAADWMASVGEGVPGYVTPKMAVGAVVGNERGEILLVQRADSGVWLYPTGWADVGYSPAEVAQKEVHEETGIESKPVSIIAVLDGLRLGLSPIPLYLILFYCRATGGSLAGHPLETADVGWFGPDDLPEPLAGAGFWKDAAFAAIEGRVSDTGFDAPRHSPWPAD